MVAYFIAGTDTEIGKTYACSKILKHIQAQGYLVQGLKPVAAGDIVVQHGANIDTLTLQQASNVKHQCHDITPYLLKTACSPHIAADIENQHLDAKKIANSMKPHLQNADLTLVEGAGGWFAPINNTETMADIAQYLSLPVVLVVGMRLGCLNHALLSVECITRISHCHLAGWVANCVNQEEMAFLKENIETLQRNIPAPCLAYLPHSTSEKDEEMTHIEIDKWLGCHLTSHFEAFSHSP